MSASGTAGSPVMIMVAPTGARAQKKDNPAIPISPEEIAEEVIRCAGAGASIAHIHARQPDGSPTQSIAVYREIVERIRERSDIVLQISLGTRGFTVEQAVEPVDLRPEMVSLPLDAYLGDDPAAQDGVRRMAIHIRDRGVRPELSVYDERMLRGALELIDRGEIELPAFFGLILRDPVSMKQGAEELMKLADALPRGSEWWVARGGRFGLGLRSFAIALGGHVRVGFEDSVLDFDMSRPAASNAHLVERIAALCSVLGRPVATAAAARAAIGASGTSAAVSLAE
jgi:3-keto-5-aminohexanoate cleavage enzyme